MQKESNNENLESITTGHKILHILVLRHFEFEHPTKNAPA